MPLYYSPSVFFLYRSRVFELENSKFMTGSFAVRDEIYCLMCIMNNGNCLPKLLCNITFNRVFYQSEKMSPSEFRISHAKFKN